MNKLTEKGYKIVRLISGLYFSCAAKISRVEYKIGSYTNRPNKCGPLAVFNSFDAATSFIDISLYIHNKTLSIFECEYEKSDDVGCWNEDRPPYLSYPTGTIFADKVKIIKVVKMLIFGVCVHEEIMKER